MDSVRSASFRENLPAWLVGGAAVSSLISIAAMEILMGAAVVALLVTKARWRIPPIWLPLAAFMILTLISLAVSDHAREGLPQVKKFYLYLMLFLVPSGIRSVRQVRFVALGWAAAAAASSAWALNQFYNKYEDAKDAHQDFYVAYVNDRITGFMDHWMTFSNQMMMALLIVAAIVFFSPPGSSTARRWPGGVGKPWLIAAGTLISLALVANETRSVYLATAVGGVYLLWFWSGSSAHRWLIRGGVALAIPALVAALLVLNPFEIRDRLLSPFRPHGNLDSSTHRAELRRIGWDMIRAHPWLGVGPEQVRHLVKAYTPPGMPAPNSSEYYGHLENDYIQYAAERGVPAMLALMWMIGWALFDFSRGLIRMRADSQPDSDRRWVLRAAVAVILSMLVAGWFSWNLNASTLLGMFLAVIGCGYVALMDMGQAILTPAAGAVA